MRKNPLRDRGAQWAVILATAGAGALACSDPESGPDDSSGPVAAREAGPGDGHGRPESDCASCHPNHVAEWRISPHAYAMRDPVFHAMVRLGQEETEGEVDQFCTQCHSPLGVSNEETEVFFDEEAGAYRQKTQGLSTEAMAGVSCEVCHSISSIDETTTFNARFEMTRNGVRRATIRDPVESAAHESAFSSSHGESDLCGVCHQVVSEFFSRRFAIEKTLTEWVQSTQKKECQGCHMPEYDGQAVPGGPERELHRHFFTGVDVSLLPPDEFPGYYEMRERVEALLQESAELTVTPEAESKRLDISIKNLAMHALPTGATADREMWIELIVKDASGAVAFESGTLDDHGDLRVDHAPFTTQPGTDPQLVLYTQHLYFDPKLEDPSSTEPRRRVEFLWEPNVEEGYLVPAEGRDNKSYDLSDLEAGDYTAEVRLLFRSFPPHLLRKLEEKAGLDPDVKDRVPIVEMERATVELTLPE